MDKKAFLADPSEEEVRFRDWSVIGAELLVKAGYITLGQSLEVEMRLYDVTLAQAQLPEGCFDVLLCEVCGCHIWASPRSFRQMPGRAIG
jgi:hypothetical protein